MNVSFRFFFACLVLLTAPDARGKPPTTKHWSPADSVIVVAGKEYKRSGFFQLLWGKNRRREWLAPTKVPVVFLDTVHGGLTPYQRGGGNESKSLRLTSAQGKEYTMRSLNKSRKDVIPKKLRNTFIGKIIQDGVSMSYPYAPAAVPGMLDHAGIGHARPTLVFIPKQAALDTFNTTFGDDLYFLEERLDGDWQDESHLGNFPKFISTLKLVRKLEEDNRYIAGQHSFIKARLFDLLISDWDRHHDNWRWGVADSTGRRFIPVPRDRDQAFFTRDGILTKILVPVTRVRFMHNFDYRIKNVKTLTSQDRKLDRLFTNEMNRGDWMEAARLLRQSLTDSAILQSIQQLPPEIFAISGMELVEKLKVRRSYLDRYAARYYKVMAKEVEINGSAMKEHFEVRMQNPLELSVKIFRVNSPGGKEATPYYQRTFSTRDTKEITLNGFGGDDEFDIDDKIRRIRLFTNKGRSENKLFKMAKEVKEP